MNFFLSAAPSEVRPPRDGYASICQTLSYWLIRPFKSLVLGPGNKSGTARETFKNWFDWKLYIFSINPLKNKNRKYTIIIFFIYKNNFVTKKNIISFISGAAYKMSIGKNQYWRDIHLVAWLAYRPCKWVLLLFGCSFCSPDSLILIWLLAAAVLVAGLKGSYLKTTEGKMDAIRFRHGQIERDDLWPSNIFHWISFLKTNLSFSSRIFILCQ